MGERFNERAVTLDGPADNTGVELAKAALLVLRQPSEGRLSVAETDEWLDMLGLREFLRGRAGESSEPELCPTCKHPVGDEWHGTRSDGRRFCRSIERAARRAMNARKRGAAA